MRDSCGTDIAFTDEQKKCIDYDSKTALVIKGTAGSGKSLMVVKRAMEYRDEILRSGTGEKVCIMTYTKTLTQGISDLIRINDSKGKEGDSGADICGDESDSYRDNCLAVANVDRYLTEICKRLGLFPKESNNYNQKIKIDLLAKELGICRSEICKLFKNELHTTFTEYLTKLRIEKAIELLNSSEANITQISEIVGFNSSSYFSETFKKFYNITPLEYKYQNSNKKD